MLVYREIQLRITIFSLALHLQVNIKTLNITRKIIQVDPPLKAESRKFLKNCKLTSYAIIFYQRIIFPIIKVVFREKRESYLFYYNAIFKDSVLFKCTQSSIEIDVIVVKNF